MKQIGTKIYYCLLTGNVIKIIGDMQGYVKETTFDEDYEIYTELKERNKSSIGLLTFKYGEYPKLSKDSTGVMVNLETKELIFSYDELPQEPQEPTEIEKIKIEQFDNSKTLKHKTCAVVKNKIPHLISQFNNGKYIIPKIQDENKATYQKAINENDVIIDFNKKN